MREAQKATHNHKTANCNIRPSAMTCRGAQSKGQTQNQNYEGEGKEQEEEQVVVPTTSITKEGARTALLSKTLKPTWPGQRE